MSNVSVTSVKVVSKITGVQPTGDLRSPTNIPITVPISVTMTAGTTANQVDREVNMQLTITTSGTMTISVLGGTYSDGTNSGSLVDKNGTQVTFARLKMAQVSLVAETGGITAAHVDPAATSAWGKWGGQLQATGTTLATPPSATLLYVNPSATGVVVDTAHSIISVVNDSAVQGHLNLDLAGGHS